MAGPRTTALGHRESNPSHAGRNTPRRREPGASAQRRLGPGDLSAPLQRLQTTVGRRAAQAGGDLARLGGGESLQPLERYPSYQRGLRKRKCETLISLGILRIRVWLR